MRGFFDKFSLQDIILSWAAFIVPYFLNSCYAFISCITTSKSQFANDNENHRVTPWSVAHTLHPFEMTFYHPSKVHCLTDEPNILLSLVLGVQHPFQKEKKLL